MSRKPSSYNNASQLKQFTDTAYDNVVIVAEHIDEITDIASGIDVIVLYLGAFPDAPAEGHNGNPLVAGNFYLNTTTGQIEYYDDTPGGWVAVDTDTVIQAAQAAMGAQVAAEAAETGAQASESNAAASALAASNSASEASTSESNALASANAAAVSETNAQNSENAAQASETAAAQSESNASTSETNAANSASAAATSASNAVTSEANAGASESAAANSATIAAGHAVAAEAAFDNFNDKYLGAKATDPTTDNDGNVLEVGATYWNTTENEQRFWSGASWDVPSDTAIQAANTAVAARDDAEIAEVNAAASASAASTSETNAAQSAADALASENAAETAETNAATSATNAATSASNAATSASNAAISETNAAQSATDAQQSADDATAIVPALQADIDNKISATDQSSISDADSLFAAGRHRILNLSNSNVNGLSGARSLLHIQTAQGGFQLAARTLGNEVHIRAADLNSGTVGSWARLYTTEYKPTATDVGAYTTTQVDAIETGLQNQINTLDGEVVKTTGNQNVDGFKTFSRAIIAARIEHALNSQQGLIMLDGGSTRLGGSGSSAGIQIRPNGLDTDNIDFDYYAVKPSGALQYEGTNNMAITRASNQHGFFAYADGRTFVTGNTNDIEFRPRGLSDSSRRFSIKEEGAIVHEHSGGAAYTFQDAVNTGDGSSSYFAWTHADGIRRGFMGFGSSANDNMTWFNDAANNNIVLKDDGEMQFNVTGGGEATFSSSGATKLNLFRSGTDTNVNMRFTSSTGSDVYAGKTTSNFAIGDGADLSSSGNQWMIIGAPAATFRVPVVLPDGDPLGNQAVRRDWAENLLFRRNVQSVTSQDWNTLYKSGFSSVNNGVGLNQPSTPIAGNAYTYGSLLSMSHTNTNSGVKTQLYFPHNGSSPDTTPRLPVYRSGYTNDYGNWRTLLTLQYADVRYTQISSDERLKTDIKEVKGALDVVNQIGSYSYIKENAEITQIIEEDGEYTGSEEHYRFEMGFIAQEIEKVFPHLVHDDVRGYKAIKTDDNTLIAVAYKAIQELSSENSDLRDEVDELKSELALIKKHLGL